MSACMSLVTKTGRLNAASSMAQLQTGPAKAPHLAVRAHAVVHDELGGLAQLVALHAAEDGGCVPGGEARVGIVEHKVPAMRALPAGGLEHGIPPLHPAVAWTLDGQAGLRVSSSAEFSSPSPRWPVAGACLCMLGATSHAGRDWQLLWPRSTSFHQRCVEAPLQASGGPASWLVDWRCVVQWMPELCVSTVLTHSRGWW